MARAGADDFHTRWGTFGELMASASPEHVHLLRHAFAITDPDITMVPSWMMIKVMSYSADRARLMDWTNHYLQRTPSK